MERRMEAEKESSELTPIEALFLEAGLPAIEVESCPVEDCPICKAQISRAA